MKGIFSEYSYEGNNRRYCGTGALYFISGVRRIDSTSAKWVPIMSLFVMMIIQPLFVTEKVVTAIRELLG